MAESLCYSRSWSGIRLEAGGAMERVCKVQYVYIMKLKHKFNLEDSSLISCHCILSADSETILHLYLSSSLFSSQNLKHLHFLSPSCFSFMPQSSSTPAPPQQWVHPAQLQHLTQPHPSHRPPPSV